MWNSDAFWKRIPKMSISEIYGENCHQSPSASSNQFSTNFAPKILGHLELKWADGDISLGPCGRERKSLSGLRCAHGPSPGNILIDRSSFFTKPWTQSKPKESVSADRSPLLQNVPERTIFFFEHQFHTDWFRFSHSKLLNHYGTVLLGDGALSIVSKIISHWSIQNIQRPLHHRLMFTGSLFHRGKSDWGSVIFDCACVRD